MIATQHTDITTTGNLQGRVAKMGIDLTAVDHLMNVLTDLYSNPRGAVIREYATNARDAHIEIGNSAPIRITLPNTLNPFLRIQDFGVGLSADDIEEIYSQYGASTKRGTNAQNGMLGLGCKSALTYTDNFTVVSVKDGERIQVSITRQATGGNMTVVTTEETDDPTGTEIIIPVKRGDEHHFQVEAETLFSFWPKGSVLINDEEPKPIDGMWLTDKLLVTPDSDDRIVMGGVAYPFNRSYDLGMNMDFGLVAFVEIGDVNFTPAREALHMTDTTKDTIKRIEEEFKAEAPGAIQRLINKAESAPEALRLSVEFHHAMPTTAREKEYTWQGRKVPRNFKPPELPHPSNPELTVPGRLTMVPRHSHVQSRHTRPSLVGAEEWTSTVWVHGWPDSKFTANHKKKLLKWLTEESGIDAPNKVERFALLKDKPTGIKEWIETVHIVDWETIKAIKLPRPAYSGGYGGKTKSIPGSYEASVDGEYLEEIAADDIDTKKPIFWCPKVDGRVMSYARVLNNVYPDGCTVVDLEANRVAKFLRYFPKAEKAESRVRVAHQQWVKSLTEEDKIAAEIAGYGYQLLQQIDPDKVDDPEIKKFARLAKRDVSAITQTKRSYANLGFHTDLAVDFRDPTDDYPLAGVYDLRNLPKHTYIYLNAAYAAEKKGA